jgi:hypothetical protein
LRLEVTSSLKQKGLRHEQKDGKDISVCTPVLEEAHGKWMGNENQTDDILVIGFQIS